jgi:hypothetical protein
MTLSARKTDNCLHCGKPLSFFQRLRDASYCTEAHMDAHSDEINRIGMSRLCEAEKSSSEIRWERCERRMSLEGLRADFAQQT